MAEIRQDFKKWFFGLKGGGQMKHFPFKFKHLNFLFLLFSKSIIFAKFSKNHVKSFLLMSGLSSFNSIQ